MGVLLQFSSSREKTMSHFSLRISGDRDSRQGLVAGTSLSGAEMSSSLVVSPRLTLFASQRNLIIILLLVILGLATLAIACFTPAFGMQKCRADQDCGRFEICNCDWDKKRGERCSSSGVCVREQACSWDLDCSSKSCKNGKCEECSFNSDCPGSRHCKSGKCGGIDECSFSSDCPGSRSCHFGKCAECSFSSDCLGSRGCKFGKCV